MMGEARGSVGSRLRDVPNRRPPNDPIPLSRNVAVSFLLSASRGHGRRGQRSVGGGGGLEHASVSPSRGRRRQGE
eukprot:5515391-Pyramimonas_sp.AAC.1